MDVCTGYTTSEHSRTSARVSCHACEWCVSTGGLWARDEQKRKIDDVARRVLFVSKPTVGFMRAAVGEDKPMTAEDGIHPSEHGYAAW